MESTAFFEKKISITPSDFNEVKSTQSVEALLLRKAQQSVEGKCSEQGYVLPGSVKLISRSMGYFESARFTGDAIYYVKLEARIIYPVDGIKIAGEVTRKNKMGLYVNYNDAIHIQVPRDLHLGSQEYDQVEVGDHILVELKRSKFAINDAYILASGLYVKTESSNHPVQEEQPVQNKMVSMRPTNRIQPSSGLDPALLESMEQLSDEDLLQQYNQVRFTSDQQEYRDAVLRIIQEKGLSIEESDE
jgi:DNA-directed RNA polymerase subunit E'/Rpb7